MSRIFASKVDGGYLHRAIDKDGKQAAKTTGIYPEQITTDKEAAFYPVIENVFGDYTTIVTISTKTIDGNKTTGA